MSIKIAVIVPVYNTEKYIDKCIESILVQSYTNFRLILVDDASPDKAGSICDEYSKKDGRITVLHQENTGVTRARANGVNLADDCEFITFVDSDDTLNPDALENLVSGITEDSDIVIGYRVYNVPDSLPIYEQRITTQDYIKRLLYWKISAAPWGKLFRKSLFCDYVFDIPREVKIGEDLIMNIRLAYRAQNAINVVQHDIYNYNIHVENTTNKFLSNPEFEAIWHNLIVSSIVDEEERKSFIRFSIPVRMDKFIKFGGLKADNSFLIQTDFYNDLKKDILQYNYPIGKYKWLFFPTNTIMRRFLGWCMSIGTKVKRVIRHPDYYIWREAINETRSYGSSPKRLEEGYFEEVGVPEGGKNEKRVICIYDSRIKSGGLVDRLRGILSVYHVCRKRKIDFKILFKHPFDLQRYLIPNKIQWEIEDNELSYNLASTDICFVSAHTGRDYEMRKQERFLKKEFRKKFKEYHVRTNAAFSYKYDFAKLFNELFKMSPLLENLINKQMAILGADYISVSFRFRDLLGDFNETAGVGMLKSEQHRKALIDKCLAQVKMLHAKYPNSKILVNSDSITFLNAADALPYTYIIPGDISHVDNSQNEDNVAHDKTFTDFFMIANAQMIYLVIIDQMYDSGYPYAASLLMNRPFHKIFA